MDEAFTSNLNGWPTGPDSDEYLTSDMEIGHGALTYSVEAKQGVYSHRYPSAAALGDFYLEAGVRQVSGPPDSVYGLAFRATGWRHYFFGISDKGDLVVRKRGDREGWLSSVRLAPTTRVNPGERNTISILAQGSHFVLCINHNIVAEADDAAFQEGKVGVGLSLSRGDRATLEYTSFKVFEPAQSMPAHGQTSYGWPAVNVRSTPSSGGAGGDGESPEHLGKSARSQELASIPGWQPPCWRRFCATVAMGALQGGGQAPGRRSEADLALP